MEDIAGNVLRTTKTLHNTIHSDLNEIAEKIGECDQSFISRDAFNDISVDLQPLVSKVVKRTVRDQTEALSSQLGVLQEQIAALQEARAHKSRLDLQIIARDLQTISSAQAKRILEENKKARRDVEAIKKSSDSSRLREMLQLIQGLKFRNMPSGDAGDNEMQQTLQSLRLQLLDIKKKDSLYRSEVEAEKEEIQLEISSLSSKSNPSDKGKKLTTQEKADVVRLKKQIDLCKYKSEQLRKKRTDLEKENSELKYRTEFTQRELKRISEDQVRLEKEWGTEKSKLDLEIRQLEAQFEDISRTLASESDNAFVTEVQLFQNQHQQAKDLILKERELFLKKKQELQEDRENMEKEMEQLERQQGDLKSEEKKIKQEAMAQLEADKASLTKEKERVKYLAQELQKAMKEIKNSSTRKSDKHRRSRSVQTSTRSRGKV